MHVSRIHPPDHLLRLDGKLDLITYADFARCMLVLQRAPHQYWADLKHVSNAQRLQCAGRDQLCVSKLRYTSGSEETLKS